MKRDWIGCKHNIKELLDDKFGQFISQSNVPPQCIVKIRWWYSRQVTLMNMLVKTYLSLENCVLRILYSKYFTSWLGTAVWYYNEKYHFLISVLGTRGNSFKHKNEIFQIDWMIKIWYSNHIFFRLCSVTFSLITNDTFFVKFEELLRRTQASSGSVCTVTNITRRSLK